MKKNLSIGALFLSGCNMPGNVDIIEYNNTMLDIHDLAIDREDEILTSIDTQTEQASDYSSKIQEAFSKKH